MTMYNKVNLSDVDGTVVKGSLVLDFFGYVCPTNEVYQAWKMDKKDESLIVDCANSFRDWLKGKTVTYVENMANEFMDTFDSFYVDVLQHISNSELDTYFISGSPYFLVKALCEKLNKERKGATWFRGMGTLYTTEKGKYTGAVELPMYAKENKKQYIENNFHSTDFVNGYGDTSSDYSILSVCENKYLTEPTEETKAFYKEKGMDNIVIF